MRDKLYMTVKHLTVALDVLFIVTLFLKYFSYLPAYFNFIYIFYLVLALNVYYFSLKIRSIKEDERENTPLVYISKYMFLLSLIVLVLNQFLKRAIVSDYISYLVGFSIAFGFLTFYASRERVEKEIEKEKIDEEALEIKRKGEFASKFPKLSRIWGLRRLVRWMYKGGWWYSAIVILLILIGFAIRFYKLGDLSLWWDEEITGNYVKKIVETGLPSFSSGLGYYWRGVAYHYLVAAFSLIFGLNEFALRLPSVLFGMGIVIIAFLFAKKINKNVALLVLAWLIFSTYNIEYSRFARFYIMNSFLFMLAIWFVWEGFFNNKFKYKIYSIITFLVMMHTVQFGAIFLSLIVVWFFFNLIAVYSSNEKLKLLKKNLVNYFLLLIIALIYKLDNLFYRLIPSNLDLEEVVFEKALNFKIPNFSLLNFYNTNYLPIFLIFFGVTFFVYLFFRNVKQVKKINFVSYLALILIFSISLYELGNQNIGGPRIYLFLEFFIILFSILSFYLLFSLFFNKNFKFIFILILFIILFLLIRPLFYERISLEYGDDTSRDPFRTTDVAKYRADYKTTYEYLKDYKTSNSLWITVMNSNYFYFSEMPNYIFNQNVNWNLYSLNDGAGHFISKREGSILINTVEDIKKILSDNPDKDVYILVNGGSVNILSTTHVKKDFLDFIEENKNKEVYTSPDRYSKILLFKKNDH